MAAGSGVLLTAAFPKVGLDALAWVALAPLLWVLNGARPGEAFRQGLIFGTAHFLTLLYWLVPTMVIYGHLPAYLGVGILFLFAFVLSLVFVAPLTCGFAFAGRTPARALVLFPLFWVAADFLRSFVFTGFPWELLGYSQYRRLHLIQISDIFGVYGLSGLVAFTNAALLLGCLAVTGKPWCRKPVGGRFAFAGVAAAAERLVEPLSERELEVLRLLADGLSNPEIAAALVVAVSTVHSHCKSIYGKLGVHRRWDAVQRARDLSLIRAGH